MIPNTFSGFTSRYDFEYTYKHSFFSLRDFHKDVLATDYWIGANCSSHHGWVLNINSRFDGCQLLNPFLSVNNVIQLPPLESNFVEKVVLSDNPTWTSNYVVMVLFYAISSERRLAFFKPGDKIWNCIHTIQTVEDVVYYKGQFYAVSLFGELVSLDINSSHQPKATRVASSPVSTSDFPVSQVPAFYIVESAGDLLFIKRHIRRQVAYNSDNFLTTGFSIFKLRTTAAAEWIELKNLKGHVIYLGNCSSLSMLSSNSDQRNPGHIYFADSKGMGIFNLEDETFQQLTPQESYKLRHPVWIQPTLNMIKSTTRVASYNKGMRAIILSMNKMRDLPLWFWILLLLAARVARDFLGSHFLVYVAGFFYLGCSFIRIFSDFSFLARWWCRK